MDTTKVKILIVEDNLSFALELEMLVEELGYEVLARVDNSGEALDLIFSTPPDLILMDVDIKGNLTGLQIGERIKHLNIPIIFITSYGDEEHYAQAQNSFIVGYLVKPANKFSLKSAIEVALKAIASKQQDKVAKEEEKVDEDNFVLEDYIFIKKKKAYHKIEIKSIQCIIADGNYSILYVGDQKFITRFKLSYLEEILPKNHFLRIHRSNIINLMFFESVNLDEMEVKVKSGQSLLVSRNKKQVLLDKMNMLG